MNYSDLSDFEINGLVADILKGDHEPICIHKDSDNNRVTVRRNGFFPLVYDVCNLWEDAGPLLEDNDICLTEVSNLWEASDNGVHVAITNKNPKRAIAECFLMMQEVR